MERRKFVKTLGATGLGALALSQASCAAKDVVIAQIQAAITMVQGLLASFGSYLTPQIQSILNTVLTQFNSLLAVVQSTTGNAIQYVAAIIPLVDQVIAALPVGTIPPLIQTAITVGLGVVQAVLRFLGNNLLHPTTAAKPFLKALAPGTQQEVQIIQDFLNRRW